MPTETVVLGESGRIVLPTAIRKQFGLKSGDRLTIASGDGQIRIMNRKMALERLRAEIAKRVPAGVSLVDELIQERGEEVRRELDREAKEKSMPPTRGRRTKEPARVA